MEIHFSKGLNAFKQVWKMQSMGSGKATTDLKEIKILRLCLGSSLDACFVLKESSRDFPNWSMQDTSLNTQERYFHTKSCERQICLEQSKQLVPVSATVTL